MSLVTHQSADPGGTRYLLGFFQGRALPQSGLAGVMLGPSVIWLCWIRGCAGLGLIHREVRVPAQMDQGPGTITSACVTEKRDPQWQWGGGAWLNVPVVSASSLYNPAVTL